MEGKLFELVIALVGTLIVLMQGSIVLLMRKIFILTRDLHQGQPHCKAFTLEDPLAKLMGAIEATNKSVEATNVQLLLIAQRQTNILDALKSVSDAVKSVLDRPTQSSIR